MAIIKESADLQALLARMDRDTAPFLGQDMQLFKQRAAKDIREKKPYIAFQLGGKEMALAIDSIQEVGNLPTITPLPNLPKWIRGIVQIRGEILSVVDFHQLFGLLKPTSGGAAEPALQFSAGDLKFCLPIERITGVVGLDEQRDSLTAGADKNAGPEALGHYIRGVFSEGERQVNILDSHELIRSPLLRNWQQYLQSSDASSENRSPEPQEQGS